MTSTTNPDFVHATEALDVAAVFPASIKDRTILITGVNKLGIGFTTAQAFASGAPRCLILAGRSTVKVQESINSLHAEYPDVDYRLLQIDLGSQSSVRAAASTVLGWSDAPAIDLVINSAGVMNLPERTLTSEGVEMHLATNHVGHFLFTNLIMSKVIAAAKKSPPGFVRIINVSSSGAHVCALRASDMTFTMPWAELPEKERPNAQMLKFADLDPEPAYIPIVAYAHSKTCNILFSVGLNNRLYEKHGILSLALNPGEIKSELSRHTDQEWLTRQHEKRELTMGMKWKTLQQGASTTMVTALDPQLRLPEPEGRGYLLSDCQIWKAPSWAVDEVDAKKLWELSEGFVGERFPW